MSEIQAYFEKESKDLDFNQLKEEHDGLIVGFLNNRRSNPNDVNHYMFVEGKRHLIDNLRIRSMIRLIPNQLIEELTDCRSSDRTDDQLVVFFPIIYKIYQPGGSRRQILHYMLQYFQNPDYLEQIDQAFDQLIKLEETFWKEHFFTPSSIEHNNSNSNDSYDSFDEGLFSGKRIKNEMCQDDCDDGNLIRQINDNEFEIASREIGYDEFTIDEPRSHVFERTTSYQRWKENLKIVPLAIEDYQKYFTYDETAILFRNAYNYNDPSYFDRLCQIFLSSYHLCQLIIFNPEMEWIMIEFLTKSKPSILRMVLKRMSQILYYEERLLSGGITSQRRSLLPLNFCYLLGGIRSLLPIDCFFPFNLDPKLVNFNFPGKISFNGDSKISDMDGFIARFDQVSGGMLNGLDWKGLNVYFTGATAELCYYNNTVFPFEYLITNSPNNPYLGSDIDLGVRIDPAELGIESLEGLGNNVVFKDELKNRAQLILEVVKKNTGYNDLELTARNNRWIISDSRLPREVDIFSFTQDPAALIYNYHMATCRVIAQLDQGQPKIQMLSSACLSAIMGTCLDRRWFTSKTSIHSRIMKQFKRGIGVILNPHETKIMIQYLKIDRRSSGGKVLKTDILYNLRHHHTFYNNLHRFIGVDLFASNQEICCRFQSEF